MELWCRWWRSLGIPSWILPHVAGGSSARAVDEGEEGAEVAGDADHDGHESAVEGNVEGRVSGGDATDAHPS